MKTVFKILWIGLVVTLVVVLLNWISSNYDTAHLTDIRRLGITFFYSMSITVVNTLFFDYFNKRCGWETDLKKRIITASTGSVVFTMITYFICRAVHLVVFLDHYSFQEFLDNEQLRYYLFPLLFAIIIMLLIYLIYFYKTIQEQKVQEQKIIAGTANAKFDALKNQLDPHFLFNSLNVLSAFIDENPKKAQQFTGSLSKVYRYVLEQKNKDLVTLGEELKFAQTYMQLLKMRFEDTILFDFPEELLVSEVKIVPLSLQLLLENTVKHNKVSNAFPLKIQIYKSENILFVKNNLQSKEVLKKGSGIGLYNIKKRYALLTKREVEVLKTENEFIVMLPLLTKKIKNISMETDQLQESSRYLQAKERMEQEKSFYGNLTAYCTVMPLLAILNYLSSSFPWVIFPALGWGLRLLFHGFSTFNYHPFFGKNWEERKIKEYMNKND